MRLPWGGIVKDAGLTIEQFKEFLSSGGGLTSRLRLPLGPQEITRVPPELQSFSIRRESAGAWRRPCFPPNARERTFPGSAASRAIAGGARPARAVRRWRRDASLRLPSGCPARS